MTDTPRKGSLFVIFLTVFIDLLGFGMVLPLLPIYARQFGADERGLLIALLMSSFSAMQFVFSPFWGRLSDRIGRRPVLMVGLAGSTIFYALFGLATQWQSLGWLFAARIGAGVAGATIATAQAYIADSTTLATRAKGMAIIGAAFGLGFTFGPLLGAAALVLSDDVGTSPWPGYVASLLSGAAFGLAWFLLPESRTADSGPAASRGINLTAWRDAFATPSIAALLLVSFISVVAFGGFETTLSLLLKNESFGFGFSLKQVLLLFAYIGVVLTFVQGGLVRRLSGRVSESKMATTGGLLTILGFGLLVATVRTHDLSLLFVAVGVEVSGFAFMTPSLQSLISRRSDPAKQGAVLGVSQSVSALARIAAPLAAVPLFQVTPTAPYWGAIGLTVLALVLLAAASRDGGDFSAGK